MIKFLLITFSILITFFICLHIGIVFILTFALKLFNWQIFIYLFIWLFLIFYLWKTNFTKIRFWKKFLIILFIFISILLSPRLIKVLPSVQTIFEIDYCIDKGGAWDKEKNQCLGI